MRKGIVFTNFEYYAWIFCQSNSIVNGLYTHKLVTHINIATVATSVNSRYWVCGMWGTSSGRRAELWCGCSKKTTTMPSVRQQCELVSCSSISLGLLSLSSLVFPNIAVNAIVIFSKFSCSNCRCSWSCSTGS